MSNWARKKPQKYFYICNRTQSCKNSPYCGKECQHTCKKEFAENPGNKRWVVANDGSKWEQFVSGEEDKTNEKDADRGSGETVEARVPDGGNL